MRAQAGDQVKAIAGVHLGQTGLVLAMDSDTGICVVLSDATREEIKVLSRHLTRSSETTAALDTYVPQCKFFSELWQLCCSSNGMRSLWPN